MSAFVNSIEIGRPADVVFAYVVDPANLPEWQRDVTNVQVAGDRSGRAREPSALKELLEADG